MIKLTKEEQEELLEHFESNNKLCIADDIIRNSKIKNKIKNKLLIYFLEICNDEPGNYEMCKKCCHEFFKLFN